MALDHFIGWCPARPFRLPLDLAAARPGITVTTQANAVTDRLAAGLHEIEKMLSGIDHDGAGRFRRLVADFLPQITRIDAAIGNGRQRAVLVADRTIHDAVQRIGNRQAIGHRLALRLRRVVTLYLRGLQPLPAHRRTILLMETGSEQIRRARGKLARLRRQLRLTIGTDGIEIEHRRGFPDEDVRVHPRCIRHEKAAAHQRQQGKPQQRGRPATVFEKECYHLNRFMESNLPA